jgi:transcriptional regulator of aromatic amino acid metabolism
MQSERKNRIVGTDRKERGDQRLIVGMGSANKCHPGDHQPKVTSLMGKTSIINNSAEQHQGREKLSKVVATDAEILIIGSIGTRKEDYARYIHQRSPRSNAAFVPIKCSELPADVFENNLFGHFEGVFIDGKPQNGGFVDAADGGTLFLDDADSLALICQIQLLRFLQEKEYRRLGETRIKQANVRIIAATNTDLPAAVRNGRFREDLFNAFTCVRLNRPLWPYGLFGALLFGIATWAIFVIFVALTKQGDQWPDPIANIFVLCFVGVLSVIPFTLVLLDFILRRRAVLFIEN